MGWDREKERKAARGYNIGIGIFALAFSIIWCCMAAASGAWFMLIFGLPMLGFMILAAVIPLAMDLVYNNLERWIEFALSVIRLWR